MASLFLLVWCCLMLTGVKGNRFSTVIIINFKSDTKKIFMTLAGKLFFIIANTE